MEISREIAVQKLMKEYFYSKENAENIISKYEANGTYDHLCELLICKSPDLFPVCAR